MRALVAGSQFDPRETHHLVLMQLGRRETREDAWRWVQANLDALLQRLRGDEAAGFMAGVAGAFCDQTHRAEAAAFLTPRAEAISGAKSQVENGLEMSSQCIREQAPIAAALERFLAK